MANIEECKGKNNSPVVKCEWSTHTVQQFNGQSLVTFPARMQVTTYDYGWGHRFMFIPEKNRLLLETTGLIYSDDIGASWNRVYPWESHGFFTYLGEGKILARGDKKRVISTDYGMTWEKHQDVPVMPGEENRGGVANGTFGPDLVDKDPKTGKILRLSESIFHHTAYLRFSYDCGLTWPTSIKVPWISETALLRAGNGDIIAATRTDGTASIPDPDAPYDWKRVGGEQDFYSGLGIHISKDNGYTWSPVNKLFEFGRHHAGLVLMPNNDIVMTYVVRLGYDDSPGGLPNYGIEAVVSHDNGNTWDIEHRYILDTWHGEWQEPNILRLMAPNETYTNLMPDGSLITAIGKGFPGGRRGVQLIRWSLNI